MDILGIFVLSTALTIGVTRGPASDQQSAYKALIKATYIQTGMDKEAKALEKRYVPKYIKEYGAWITLTGKIVTEKKVSYEWTF